MTNPTERVDDLQLKGLKIIQNPNQFCFGVDAVLLSHFSLSAIKPKSKILDICSGNGIVPILLYGKTKAPEIVGLEIQECVAEMAKRSVLLNNIEDRVRIDCGDLKNAKELYGRDYFDVVTCNPPYKEAGGGLKNLDDSVMIARHEILCSLEDIIKSSREVLKQYGKLELIHRPERLIDIITLMKQYRLEPKRIQFIHPSPKKTATMVLVEGVKFAKPKLFLEPPLYVYDQNGEYTEEIDKIYGRV